MANCFSILALRLYEHYEKGKGQDSERGTPQAVGAQYDAGDQWRNNSRKNEERELKQKQHPVVDALVIEVKSNAVKSNLAQKSEMLGP